MEIIIGREGNQATPITDKTVSRRHCRVTSNPDGTFTIENLSAGGTWADGQQILRATVRPDSRLRLGPSFTATLSQLIGPLSNPEKNSTQNLGTEVPTVSISHLKNIWETHNRINNEMAELQRKTNLVRSGSMIFTMGGGLVAALIPPVGIGCSVIGIAGVIYSFVGMKKTETPAQRQQRQDAFDDAWVCPNPRCNHTLLAKNYKKLVNDYKTCPYCRCKYTEQ